MFHSFLPTFWHLHNYGELSKPSLWIEMHLLSRGADGVLVSLFHLEIAVSPFLLTRSGNQAEKLIENELLTQPISEKRITIFLIWNYVPSLAWGRSYEMVRCVFHWTFIVWKSRARISKLFTRTHIVPFMKCPHKCRSCLGAQIEATPSFQRCGFHCKPIRMPKWNTHS